MLKKVYPPAPAERSMAVLDALIYAVCLEGTPRETADAVSKRLKDTFHDLNEVRVSSISELQGVFAGLEDPQWRALRIKNILQYVFETNYAFDFESLKRKTGELAVKQLMKIPALTPYVRGYCMQHALGAHLLPVDARMRQALVWLGLADSDSTPEQASESLRPYVRKADAVLFCHLLHELATDQKRSKAFASPGRGGDPDAGADPLARLDALLKRPESLGRLREARPPAGRSERRSGRAARTRLGTRKRT
jgi:endonuclease-3